MVKLNKIYTRTGDDGTTGLVDGSRTSKNSLRMEAIGAVDETNSAIGLLVAQLHSINADVVHHFQNDLFDLGADLATPAGENEDFAPSEMVLRIVPAQVEHVERSIDALNEHLSPLTSFILPGGTEPAARAHIARASARRAERAMVALAEQEPVNPAALAYINRLSDYLFVLARSLNDHGRGDITWKPGANR